VALKGRHGCWETEKGGDVGYSRFVEVAWLKRKITLALL
jgi:hypothetical protein